MPHHHERAEKICLNCGAAIHGRFCHACGQENLDPKESIWHIVRHFLEDITHFDGKFFSSLKYLFLKPGFLTEEYIKGHRVPYLHPIRMYMFASAVFFLCLYTFFVTPVNNDPRVAYIRDTIEQNNTHFKGFSYSTKNVPGFAEPISYFRVDHRFIVNGAHVYDSIHNSLPDTSAEKAGYFLHFLYRNMAAAASVYHKDPNTFMEKYMELFLHSFSKIFFITLPLFALMLHALNRKDKNNYFVGNAVFSIHFFCAVFIFMLLGYIIGYIDQSGISSLLIFLGAFVYLFIAMQRFYKYWWYKTLGIFFVQSFFFTFILTVLVVIFWLHSILSLVD